MPAIFGSPQQGHRNMATLLQVLEPGPHYIDIADRELFPAQRANPTADDDARLA